MYTKILKNQIAEQANVYEQALRGDLSSVNYAPVHSPEYGICDRNAVERARLAFFLLFEHADQEGLIKALFEEELQDCENSSFQGIGRSLEVLAFLLRPFNADGRYDSLFERAKNANFDCACGYDNSAQFTSDWGAYTLEDCICLAIKLKYFGTARELVALWQSSVTKWTPSAYQLLIYFNDRTGNSIDNEAPYLALLAFARTDGKAFRIASILHQLMRYYIQHSRWSRALHTFQAAQNEIDFSQIEQCNLMSFLLEDCLELIESCPEHAQAVWDWAKPHLRKKSDSLYGQLYEKSIEAASLLDSPFAAELSEAYAVWRNKVSLNRLKTTQ